MIFYEPYNTPSSPCFLLKIIQVSCIFSYWNIGVYGVPHLFLAMIEENYIMTILHLLCFLSLQFIFVCIIKHDYNRRLYKDSSYHIECTPPTHTCPFKISHNYWLVGTQRRSYRGPPKIEKLSTCKDYRQQMKALEMLKER